MDRPVVMTLSEVSQTEKFHFMISFICGILTIKQQSSSQDGCVGKHGTQIHPQPHQKYN